jgi:7,8-dihydropterin-6-yl-methyl-4-(beta-D-ribofuranosyl)aminobenzene 5'-phosphate synthase
VSAELSHVAITTVVENHVDMLLPDSENVVRAGLTHHFDPKRAVPCAENGVALLVDATWSRYRYTALFDTAMTGGPLLHNAGALDLDLQSLDHVVISHGHPDHYGGLEALLTARDTALPVSIHDAAFRPRYLRLASGQVAPYYNHGLTPARVEEAGGALVLHSGPLEVGPGMIATGAIPRRTDFEAPPTDISGPNALIQISDGEMGPDAVDDDQALVLLVGSDAIVVLVGCSHAGVINTLLYASEITGRTRIAAVIGGFHLGFPGTPDSRTDMTIDALRELDVEVLCPMHCTGMRAMMRIADAFPDRFVLNCTGTTLHVDAQSSRSGVRRNETAGA